MDCDSLQGALTENQGGIEGRNAMIGGNRELPVPRQCELLALSRSTAYYQPLPTPEADLTLMRRIDELHLKWPILGARNNVFVERL